MSRKYNVQEEAAERFYRLPKVFFTNEQYKKLSNDAKIAFAILQDRLELSIRNQWFDTDGNIYFLYGNQELGDILNCSKPTVIKIKKELHKADLLEEKRMGLSQSNRLYLLKPIADFSDVEEWKQPKTDAETLVPQQKLKSFTSRSQNSLPQEVKNLNTNDTELNETDLSDTEKRINLSGDDWDLPSVVVEVLEKNQKRLMDDEIKITDIINHFKAHQGILTDYQYADALQYSLERTPGRINSITARLTKAVEDKRKWLNEQNTPTPEPVRREIIPEWLKEQRQERQQQEQAAQPESNTSLSELEAEKQRILESLKKRKSQ